MERDRDGDVEISADAYDHHLDVGPNRRERRPELAAGDPPFQSGCDLCRQAAVAGADADHGVVGDGLLREDRSKSGGGLGR